MEVLGSGSASGTRNGHRRRVGLIHDDRMCNHRTPDGDHHPENPNRTRVIWNKLQSSGITQRCLILDAKEAENKHILSVHTKNHVKLIRNVSSKQFDSRRNRIASKFNSIYLNEGSSEAAYLAAGSVIEAVDRVAKGELDSAFAIVRPPGHHAEPDEAMGFCLFNNVAVATSFLLKEKELGINKILIVDWDVHHGNGTQKMFWKDPRVLFFSVHRHEFGSFYPANDDGSYTMIGEGPGAGYNINVPWENGRCGDADYLAVWDHILVPVAKDFNPDLIIISAGFDAAVGDPLGGCRVTPYGYSIMLKKLMDFAQGKIVLALEGGYNLDSIANSALACVEVLLEDKTTTGSIEAYPFESTWRVIQAVRRELSDFWPTLADQLPLKLTSKKAPAPDPDTAEVIMEDVVEPELMARNVRGENQGARREATGNPRSFDPQGKAADDTAPPERVVPLGSLTSEFGAARTLGGAMGASSSDVPSFHTDPEAERVADERAFATARSAGGVEMCFETLSQIDVRMLEINKLMALVGSTTTTLFDGVIAARRIRTQEILERDLRLQQLEATILKLGEEKIRLNEVLLTANADRLESLEKELATSKVENADLKFELDMVRSELKFLREESGKVAYLEGLLAGVLDDVNAANDRCSDLEEELKDTRESCDELKDEVEAISLQKDLQTIFLSYQWSAQEESLKRELLSSQERVTSLDRELQDARVEISDLRARPVVSNRLLTSELDAVRTELRAARERHTVIHKEAQQVRLASETMRQSRNELGQRVARMSETSRENDMQIYSLTNELEELRGQLSAMTEEAAIKDQVATEAHNEWSRLMQENTTLRDNVFKLEQECQKLGASSDEWKEKSQKLEEESANLRQANMEKETQVASNVGDSSNPAENTLLLKEKIDDLVLQRDERISELSREVEDTRILAESSTSQKDLIHQKDVELAHLTKMLSDIKRDLEKAKEAIPRRAISSKAKAKFYTYDTARAAPELSAFFTHERRLGRAEGKSSAFRVALGDNIPLEQVCKWYRESSARPELRRYHPLLPFHSEDVILSREFDFRRSGGRPWIPADFEPQRTIPAVLGEDDIPPAPVMGEVRQVESIRELDGAWLAKCDALVGPAEENSLRRQRSLIRHATKRSSPDLSKINPPNDQLRFEEEDEDSE